MAHQPLISHIIQIIHEEQKLKLKSACIAMQQCNKLKNIFTANIKITSSGAKNVFSYFLCF